MVVKIQEAKGILSNLGLKTPLNKIPFYSLNSYYNNSIK